MESFKLGDEEIKLTRWSLGFETLPSNWSFPKDRWVSFFGLSYHLMSYELLESLCKRFGHVEEFAKSVLHFGINQALECILQIVMPSLCLGF